MLREYSFRPRAWALALAALGCVLFVGLGNWQSRRAADKRELAFALDAAMKSPPIELAAGPVDAAQVAHTRIAARGSFVPERSVLLDNKLRRGRPGYEVVTPLRLADSPWHVLVDRGWIAAPPSRETLPAIRTPAGEVRLEGVALDRLPQALEAGAQAAGTVRQNLDLAAYAAESGLRLQPIVIEQHSELDDGLLRDWPRADFGIEKHESYALQWYSFAALALVLAAVFSFRRVV
ncbi:MAG TPA: SURF1 family protein [Burkholderiales bacterium]|nr:SURF1 family protein [Burkholderiales bacterium]